MEIQARNGMMFARCGGLKSLMSYQLNHPDDAVRVLSNQIFSELVQNNETMQEYALHCGAFSLMHQFVKENSAPNKRALMTALSSFLLGDNPEGKRAFCCK